MIAYKKTISIIGIFILMAMPLTSATLFQDESRLLFGMDDLGIFGLFFYTLPQNVIYWLNSQSAVENINIDNQGYTQVWLNQLDINFRNIKQKVIDYDKVKELKEIQTQELIGGCKNPIFTRDRVTGEIYEIYIENGQIKYGVYNEATGCL